MTYFLLSGIKKSHTLSTRIVYRISYEKSSTEKQFFRAYFSDRGHGVFGSIKSRTERFTVIFTVVFTIVSDGEGSKYIRKLGFFRFGILISSVLYSKFPKREKRNTFTSQNVFEIGEYAKREYSTQFFAFTLTG